MENDVNEIDCFARCDKGCMALNYSIMDLNYNLCNKCKFRKTRIEREMMSQKPRNSKIKGFNLIFDNINEGFFGSIKEIDNWLIKFWNENKEKEFIPRDCEFNDFNVLFYTHEIRFKVI